MMVSNDWIGALILGSVFMILVGIAELWHKRGVKNPELPRKFVHFFGGIGCLAFPFLVKHTLTVFLMALFFAGVFFVSGKLGRLKSLHGVSRKSFGAEYYPFSVVILFYICKDQLWLYLTSILIMTLADAAASIVGGRYGSITYEVDRENRKSLEGSFFFCLLALQIIQVPMLLMTDIPRAVCILSALLVALILTAIEAVATRGSDNIFVPIFCCYILMKITTKPVAEVACQCLSLITIAAVLIGLSRWSSIFRLRDSLLFTIFCYGTWSLAGFDWTVPVFVIYLIYLLTHVAVKNKQRYDLADGSLLTALVTPVGVVLLANGLRQFTLFYASYLAVIILTLTNGGLNFFLNQIDLERVPRRTIVVSYAVSCALMVLVVANLLVPAGNWTIQSILVVLVILCTLAYNSYLGTPDGVPLKSRQVRPVWMLSLFAGLVLYLLQSLDIIPLWGQS